MDISRQVRGDGRASHNGKANGRVNGNTNGKVNGQVRGYPLSRMPTSAIADFVAVSKYSRFRESLQRREVFPETVNRTREMHLRRYPEISSEINWAFDRVQEKRVLPSMRSMQFGGRAIEETHNRMFNCFAGSERFVTATGVVSFEETVGQTVRVLAGDGQWREARVLPFGKQPLIRVKLQHYNGRKHGNAEHDVLVTPNHRWLLENGHETTGLKEGDVLACPSLGWEEDEMDIEGVRHGFVYGDGTLNWSKGREYAQVRLCGKKARLLHSVFEGCKHSFPPSCDGEPIVYLGHDRAHFKELPKTSEARYVASFIHGLMLADGSPTSIGNVQIASQNADLVAWLKSHAALAGLKVLSHRVYEGTTNYGERSAPLNTVLLGTGSAARFRVVSVEILEEDEGGQGTVYCVVEPVTRSFVLANGQVTGNCSFSNCDRLRFFQEAFFLSLCGSGVGFSVQKHHVEKLPPLIDAIDETNVRHHVIKDTIEGWADALGALMVAYTSGHYVEFSYHKIRPYGAPLKKSGGKAPGHLGLKRSLDRCRAILDGALGRQLRPIEAHDIVCTVVDAVLSGGIRRSALLSLFSVDDQEMMEAKTGNWYETAPWRRNANNSAALHRPTVKMSSFDEIFRCVKEWGDPGVFFLDDMDTGVNPCGEVTLKPVLEITDWNMVTELYARGYEGQLKPGDRVTGWQQCNLTEMNASLFDTEEDVMIAAKAAAIIGTCQAGYTDYAYLGPVSELVTERDYLLGVSMTGMVDRPALSFDPEIQRRAALLVVETNKEIADKIGIGVAARTTCVKPSGKTSLVLGCVGSGIHAHPGRRYFRRVIATKIDPVYRHFRETNPHMCEEMNDRQDLVTFCVTAPEQALTLQEQSAQDLLERVILTKRNWVEYGTVRKSSPMRHNISNTIHVRPGEWDLVKEFIWDHRDELTGLTLFAYDGDKKWPNAPRETVKTPEDEEKWKRLVSLYRPVDYSLMVEEEDTTDLQGEMACAGGLCELSY